MSLTPVEFLELVVNSLSGIAATDMTDLESRLARELVRMDEAQWVDTKFGRILEKA